MAAFVPLATQYLWFCESPSLMTTGFGYVRGTTVLSTVKDFLDFIWSDWNHLLMIVLVLRYYRIFFHTIAYLFWYEPSPVPDHPTVTARNVHVIIPTIDPENEDFIRCVRSVLSHAPAFITVVTANEDITTRAQIILANLPEQDHTFIRVMTGPMANKRHQLTHVLNDLAQNEQSNKDTIVVFVDDHVWWPSPRYLVNLIAPFENPKIGIVATNKRVQRERGRTFAESFLNFIACIYLERHNFEMTATNAIDGGIFVVSGRTCAVRASIVLRQDFREGFTNERFFFNMFGPLNPDDDNYITRYMVRNEFGIKVQNMGSDTLMETTLGTVGGYKKFRGQLLRWCRTQWRSNSATLFTDRTVWRRQPWSVHAIFITWFFNFAVLADGLILYLWSRSDSQTFTVYHLLALLWGSKIVKLLPFFWRNPRDLWLFPIYVLFAYFHSFLKIWTLITFWDHNWSGRDLSKIGMAVSHKSSNDVEDSVHESTDKAIAAARAQSHYQPHTIELPFADNADYECSEDFEIYQPTVYEIPEKNIFADFHSLSSQSSRSMSISTRPRMSRSISPSSRNSDGDNFFHIPSISSRTSSIATSNTMLNKYGKTQEGETPNGYSPEGTFTTMHDYHTPWGGVSTKSPHLTPANARQSQSPSPPASRSPKPISYPSPRFTTPEKSTNDIRMLPTPPLSTMKTALYVKSEPISKATIIKSEDDFAPLYDNVSYTGEPDFATKSESNMSSALIHSPLPSPSKQSTTSSSSFSKFPVPTSTNQPSQILIVNIPQPATFDGKASKSSCSSSKTTASKQKYIREFLRGHDCGRIHADGTNIVMRCCQTPLVKNLPTQYVVRGRPRI